MSSELTFKPMGPPLVNHKGLERVADVDPRLTRSHYFDNRLLTAEDLTRDQLYLDGRLREVGQCLGYGVVRGLNASLNALNSGLQVSPGLAVSFAGRALELSRNLTIDLVDRAAIAGLNGGRHRHLERGLYALILRYAEFGTGAAEVFPTDLAERRTHKYDVISEGVQLALIRLPQPLAQQHPLHVRANLLQAWQNDNTADGALPEDSAALGVLAISDGRPQWFDPELLRQPLRSQAQPGDAQRDLARRYQALFGEVMAERELGTLGSDFAATDYFRLLPPVGSLPKGAINPAGGHQGFFPDNFRVWVAPVRRSDMELIRRESMVLPPIDLTSREPLEVVVLAPLDNADYGHYAQRLEATPPTPDLRLPSLDLLRLRLYPRQPVHQLDTDEATWTALWARVPDDELFYVRRPLRTAETSLSGIVLARGVALPDPVEAPLPSPSDSDLLQDEDSVFLNRMNPAQLVQLRPPQGDNGETAATLFQEEFGGDALATQQCARFLMRIERRYDALVWQTLLTLARNEQLAEFIDQLTEQQNQEEPLTTGSAVAELGPTFDLDADLVTGWQNTANN